MPADELPGGGGAVFVRRAGHIPHGKRNFVAAVYAQLLEFLKRPHGRMDIFARVDGQQPFAVALLAPQRTNAGLAECLVVMLHGL